MAELLVLVSRLVLVLTSCLLVSSYGQTCTWHEAAVPVASVECRHTSSLLTVHYDTAVTCEQDLSGKNLTNAPTVSWRNGHSADIYLLIMIDPDASTPCKPDLRYVIHWAAFVSGSNDLRITDEFISYRGPHPPEGTPPHRYQFFLYRWVPEITLLHPTFLGNDNSSRFHFDYDQFKAVNRLEHLEAFFEFQYSR
ncbi:protein D1-like isoform X1 [Pomacea canaliculata]|uniref:protein D1-like isoform X1 n=1 Tax=Pomacea canaliculata TaxID=400727 RepID=UPI000D73E6AD|nr:protein D1-like isoform X1 [Pomacea canaliculata]